MKRKLFLLLCALLTMIGVQSVKAQASYNKTYTEGVEVAAGGNYFLYNIASGMFLTDGMDFGTHASIDHAGRVITLATSGGGYTINSTPFSANGTALKDGGLFLNGDGEPYVDGTSATWTFEPVSAAGYTNAYAIKTGDKYLYIEYKDGLYQGKMGAFVRAGNSTGDTKSYWLLIPMSTRQAVKDYTYYLRNTDMCHPWEFPVWNTNNVNFCVGSKENVTAEAWHAEFDFSQTIDASIPNGKYVLHCQGFYIDTETPSVLYANSDQANLMLHQKDCDAATSGTKFLDGAYADNSVTTVVTNGQLTVGVTDPSKGNWQVFDNFYLEYFGTCVVNDAVALPAGGAMSADTWYYYDIPTSDAYEFTSSAAATLTYTADGAQLTAGATGTNVTFTAGQKKEIELTNGRLYLKTNEATTLNVSYKYSVSAATVDKTYIQPNQTVTVSYIVSTNNPSAVLTQNYNGVTFDGKAINVTPGESGFTCTVPADLEANREYTLAIPAGAIGYAAGSTYNAAQEFTLKTPAVYDGTYFLTTTVSEKTKYLSRMTSNDASVDNFGLGFNLTTDKDGVSFIQFLENENYYLDDNNNYKVATKTKRGANTNKWVIVAVAGGYKVRLQANTNCELTVANTTTGKVEITHGTQNGYVWNFITPEAHETAMQAWVDAQAAIAATGAGISATTKAALETAISGYEALAIALPEGYNVSGVQDKFQAGGDLFAEKTLTGLTNGLYKLSLYGYQRISSNVITYAAYGKNAGIGVEYLQANGQQTRMMSVMDVASDEAWDSKDYHGDNGKYYPNNTTGAKAAFDAGKYANDVYVYVSNGTLSYKLYNPSNPQCENWCPYYTFSLTLYSDGMPDVDISTLAAKPMNAETKTALNNASATYDGSKTTANYSALQTAIFNAEASVVVYETIDAAITKVEAWSVTTAAAGIRSKYNSGTYSNETTAANIYAEYQAAEISALAADGSAVDWTSVILNASFETGDMTGWTAESRTDTGVKDQSNGTYSITSGDPVDGLKLFNSWGGTAENNVYQTIKNLPAGAYTLTALVAGFKDEQLILAANETTNSVTVTGDKTVGYTVEVKFTLAEDGDVVIKASNTKSAGTSDASFIKADNFHLYVATVSKTITSAGWATFCSPYALDLEHATGLTDAYIVTGGSTGVLTKTSVKDGTVPANTGLLLKGDAGTVTIPVVASSSTNVEANKLVGVNAATEIAANAGYVLMGSPSLGFYQNANVFTVGANTAYLPSNFDGSGARDFFRLEDDFTGINAIEAAEAEDGALKDGKYLIGNKIVLVKNGVKYSANGQILK